jgi:LacI family transcriptional regulator
MSREIPTIRDVAGRAGVSPATVSNVLGGRRNVAPELRARVREAVRQLGYVVDHGASRLRSGRALVIGALVPDLANPFFSAFVAALEALVRQDGYALLVAGSGAHPEHEAQRLRALVAWRPAGIVVIPADDAFAARSVPMGAGVPVVVADRIPDRTDHDVVGVDNAAAAAKATRHLLGFGHESLLVVASSRKLGNVRERIAGVEAALAGAQPGLRAEIVEAGFDGAQIRTTLRRCLHASTRPTAVLTLNIDATLSALEAIAHSRLAVPRDLALVSFDDYEWMRVASPAISAVRQPTEAIAEAVWARMRARIDGDSSPPQELRLACAFEARASSDWRVGPARAAARLTSHGLRSTPPGRTRTEVDSRWRSGDLR